MLSKTHNYSDRELILKQEDLKKDLKGRAIRSAGITIFERISEYGLNTISIIILARLLTPRDFGLVAMVASIAGVFGILRDLGLSDVTVQASEISHSQASTLFWVNSIFNGGIALVLIACSPLLAMFYKEQKLSGITILYSFSFIFIGLSTQHIALMKRYMRFGQIAIIGISSTVLGVMSAIILALLGFGYWAIVAKQIVLALCTAIGAWLFLSWRPGLPSFTREIWQMIKMGLNIVGFFIVNYLAHNMDKTLIGWRLGADSLGYYDRAFQLSVMPVSLLAMPLHAVAVSTLSKLKHEPTEYSKYYINSLKILTFFGLPISAFLFLMSNDIVLLLLGPNWGQTAHLFKILSISIWASIMYGTHGWLHVSLGRTDRWFKWGLISTPILIIAYFVALNWGTKAVAASYAIVLGVLAIPSILYAGRPIGLRLDSFLRHLWRCLLSTGASCIPLFFVIPLLSAFNIWIRLFVSLLFYGILYLLFLIMLYRSLEPVKNILDLIPNLVRRSK